MSALDGLTVAITTHKRPDRLARCVASVREAGIKHVVIAGDEPGTEKCNDTWILAAYRATTKRVLLLHDDDMLLPQFGEIYENVISPALDKGDAGFASWDAILRHDDGRDEPCSYWPGAGQGSVVVPAKQLWEKVVGVRGRLSLSPVVSVFNRTVLIRACKEAADHLRLNACLERPGMVLGTEILAYARHCQYFKRWLYIDQPLSAYGAGDDSGTVKAQKLNQEGVLTAGYDLARDQALCAPPEPANRLLLTYSPYQSEDPEARRRIKDAEFSWRWHFGNAEVLDFPYRSDLLPKIKDILDQAVRYALPEDIVVYANTDVGFTTRFPELVRQGIARGNGVTCLTTRSVKVDPGRLYKSVTNCKAPGGIDAIAVTPAWWKAHRDKMPDMYIGREAWDSVFAMLAQEWADGRACDEVSNADLWFQSRAHADDCIYHEPHNGFWETNRFEEKNAYNRDLARKFFQDRAHAKGLDMLR